MKSAHKVDEMCKTKKKILQSAKHKHPLNAIPPPFMHIVWFENCYNASK